MPGWGFGSSNEVIIPDEHGIIGRNYFSFSFGIFSRALEINSRATLINTFYLNAQVAEANDLLSFSPTKINDTLL